MRISAALLASSTAEIVRAGCSSVSRCFSFLMAIVASTTPFSSGACARRSLASAAGSAAEPAATSDITFGAVVAAARCAEST